MKNPRRELKVEGAVELPHVISYLEALVEALKSGTVRVHRGEEEVVLGPRGVLGFSLAAVDRGKRQRLSLELSWRKLRAPEEALDLAIGPAPAAEERSEPVAVSEVAALYAGGLGHLAGAEYTDAPAEATPDESAESEPAT